MLNERLQAEIPRIVSKINDEKEKMIMFEIKEENGKKNKIKFPISNIMYFSSFNRKIELHTLTKVYQLRQSGFEELKKFMGKYNFVEIHRTCIVNVRCIYSLNDQKLELDNHEILDVSRRHVKKVEIAFTEYLKKDLI